MRITAGTMLLMILSCSPARDQELVSSVASTTQSASPTALATPRATSVEPSAPLDWTHEALGGEASYDPFPDTPGIHSTAVFAKSTRFIGGNATDMRREFTCWRRWQVTIPDPGSGWVEVFMVQEPCYPRAEGAPLLVVFHKFGSSHLDAQANTDFFELAGERGWFVVAPLSAATKHYGSTAAMINTSVVLDYMAENFPLIDRNRMYGVGFSMGAGAMLAYAALHVDPAKPMFAALVTHTGGGALWHTYGNSPDDDDSDDNVATGQNLETPDILDFWFGGSPTTFPFEYQSHSVMNVDPFLVTLQGTSLTANLVHVPVNTWYAGNDPVEHLKLLTIHIALEIQSTFFGASFLTPVAGSAHTWNTLNETAVLDWFEPQTLTLPTSGSTVAVHDGVWFHFDVVQEAAGALTRFDWDIDTGTNTATILNTTNLQRIVVDTLGSGLDPDSDLTLNVSNADASTDEIRFLDIALAPSIVLRDGLPDSNWVHDAQAQTLTVTESDGLPHQWWLVTP